MSEVISFIFGFVIAFLILTTSLYAFSLVASDARNLNGQAEMQDLANRVALGVQESLQIGTHRRDSTVGSNSGLLRYERVLYLPLNIQGDTFQIGLNNTTVLVQSSVTGVKATASTFNATALLPVPPAPCSTSYAVCELRGSLLSGSGKMKITYQYQTTPIMNRIEIAEGT